MAMHKAKTVSPFPPEKNLLYQRELIAACYYTRNQGYICVSGKNKMVINL